MHDHEILVAVQARPLGGEVDAVTIGAQSDAPAGIRLEELLPLGIFETGRVNGKGVRVEPIGDEGNRIIRRDLGEEEGIRPEMCRTDDGGKSWKEYNKGLPQENCFDIIYRHALASSGDAVVFGTTTGNLFFSHNRGESWEVINNYLPMVHSVQFAD